jgi:hypothetical protein
MSLGSDPARDRLRTLHDELLRGPTELRGADEVATLGPVSLARFADHGLVTYRDLGGVAGTELRSLVEEVVAYFAGRGLPFEWKTRSHDVGEAELEATLRTAGLQPEPTETVMIGEPRMLCASTPLPAGLVLRRAGADGHELADDVAAAGRLYAAVFPAHRPDYDRSLLDRLRAQAGDVQLWLVTVEQEVIAAGRLDLDGAVAGLWGGATDAAWRGRGLYRALTAARCGVAAERQCSVVYAECTEYSRPILQRSGLQAVTTTTPYVWSPDSASRAG